MQLQQKPFTVGTHKRLPSTEGKIPCLNTCKRTKIGCAALTTSITMLSFVVSACSQANSNDKHCVTGHNFVLRTVDVNRMELAQLPKYGCIGQAIYAWPVQSNALRACTAALHLPSQVAIAVHVSTKLYTSSRNIIVQQNCTHSALQQQAKHCAHRLLFVRQSGC